MSRQHEHDDSFFETAFPYCGLRRASGMAVLTVPKERYLEFITSLRDAGYNYLSGITAVDMPAEGAINVVGHAYRIPSHDRVQFVVSLDREAPELESAVPVWPTANWHEREVYDMFGVRFTGHPCLSRILLTEGFCGHPLRKDFVKGGERA